MVALALASTALFHLSPPAVAAVGCGSPGRRGSQVSRQRQRQRGQSMLTVGVDVVPAGLVAELEALAVDHLGVEVALRVREAGVGVAALSPEWRVRAAEAEAECRANEP